MGTLFLVKINSHCDCPKTFEEFGRFIPLATWVGGLSAWRLGQISDAAFYFQRLRREHEGQS